MPESTDTTTTKPGTTTGAATTTDGTTGVENTEPNGTTTEPTTFSQADVDRIIADRLKREDVKGLKAAKQELDTLKAAQMSEADRLKERADAAEQQALEARAETLRYKIATQFGINSDDAETFLTGTDEDTLTKQAERLATLAKTADSTSPAPRPDLSQGARSGSGQSSPEKDFARFITGQLDKR
jgi:hypothetical protein